MAVGAETGNKPERLFLFYFILFLNFYSILFCFLFWRLWLLSIDFLSFRVGFPYFDSEASADIFREKNQLNDRRFIYFSMFTDKSMASLRHLPRSHPSNKKRTASDYDLNAEFWPTHAPTSAGSTMVTKWRTAAAIAYVHPSIYFHFEKNKVIIIIIKKKKRKKNE